MLLSSKEQRQYIYKLCRYDKAAKEEAVSGISEGRTTSTTGLSYTEANTLIVNLGGKPILYDNWAYFDKKKKNHRQIISLCIQLGWSVKDDKYGEIADLGRLSQWLKSDKSPVRKKLKQMNNTEVSKIIGALQNMIVKKYEKLPTSK